MYVNMCKEFVLVFGAASSKYPPGNLQNSIKENYICVEYL